MQLNIISAITNRLLTIDEAATYLGLSKLTMYAWINKRKIECVKVGRIVRFREQTLEKWIEKNAVKPRQAA